MVQRISDTDVIGPDYKDQARTAMKNTGVNQPEIPGLLEAEAIPASESWIWRKTSTKWALVGTTIVAIVVIVIGSVCGATGCSSNRSSSNAPTPTTINIRSPGVAPSNQVDSGRPCGDGFIGSGVCSDNTLCCSSFGFCGTTAEHCSKDTCGNGVRGNGNCTGPNLCCSPSGFCGSTLEYCTLDACGNGSIGNGNCTDPNLCCSSSGYCGSTSEYCG